MSAPQRTRIPAPAIGGQMLTKRSMRRCLTDDMVSCGSSRRISSLTGSSGITSLASRTKVREGIQKGTAFGTAEAVPFQNGCARLSARLKRLRKKSEKQIPRGLKPARDDKNKQLRRWPKGQLYPKSPQTRLFQQPLKPCPLKTGARRTSFTSCRIVCFRRGNAWTNF